MTTKNSDVLAVMANAADLSARTPEAKAAMLDARSAVVELVEAAKDVGLYLANMDEQESGPAIRLRVALAKVTGGAA
jgi:hypothetical protein